MRRVGLVAGAVALALSCAGPAFAQSLPTVVDGKTAMVSDYDQAIRERVYIPNGLDADRDGVEDRSAIEIMRPRESSPTMKVPAIVAPSPYYTSACGQFVGECIGDLDADGVNDRWPLWYDNFFVPRGYAVILAEMGGTANSTGCATNGGREDVLSTKVVIDWLNGRLPGYRSATGTADPVLASWHTGKAAMIGRSYNGTLPNAVAATGVEGLTTIVPIAAISSWYDYSRMGGIIGSTPHYPAWLSNFVTDAPRQAICAPVRDAMSLLDGDADGTMNPFWDERNYRPDANKVKASVFATHCLQDDNVDPDQTTEWWHALARNNVPRKLWLCREGHIDPFMTNRAEWMRQLHAWFDHWLFGLQNGIMSEPRVDIEDTKDNWAKYSDWPLPGASNVNVFLQGDTASTAGRARRRLGRRDRHAGLDRPAQPERGDGAEHRGEHDPEQPPRVPLARAEGRPAPLRLAAAAPARVAGQAAVEHRGDARRLRPEHPDHPLRRRHLDARQRAQRLLGRVVDPRRPRRPGDGLRRLLPAADQADGQHQRHPGLAPDARDHRLLQPRVAVRRDARHAGRRVRVRLPDHARRLHDPSRPPARRRADGQLQRAPAQQHHRHADHAQRAAEHGLAAGRRRLRRPRGRGRAGGRHGGAGLHRAAGEHRPDGRRSDRRRRDVPAAGRDRQRGPVARRRLRSRVRLAVPGRLDAGHVHGDRRLGQHRAGRRSPCSCAARSRSAGTCPRRCR